VECRDFCHGTVLITKKLILSHEVVRVSGGIAPHVLNKALYAGEWFYPRVEPDTHTGKPRGPV
jgi:hypothetical protein